MANSDKIQVDVLWHGKRRNPQHNLYYVCYYCMEIICMYNVYVYVFRNCLAGSILMNEHMIKLYIK